MFVYILNPGLLSPQPHLMLIRFDQNGSSTVQLVDQQLRKIAYAEWIFWNIRLHRIYQQVELTQQVTQYLIN